MGLLPGVKSGGVGSDFWGDGAGGGRLCLWVEIRL